ncbi:hypothetical protein HDV01_004364 [Terramyces sp. JEL0728]|nr:hypothetical protein HDV01_004364 [Terramyces sp. JEL0728]
MKSNELLGLFVRKQFTAVIDKTKDKSDELSTLMFTEASVILGLPVEHSQQTLILNAIKLYNNQQYYKARELIESNLVANYELISVYVKTMAELQDDSVLIYIENSGFTDGQKKRLLYEYELYSNTKIEEIEDLEEETIDGGNTLDKQEPNTEPLNERNIDAPLSKEPETAVDSVNELAGNEIQANKSNNDLAAARAKLLEFIHDMGVPIGLILSLLFYFMKRNTNSRIGRLIAQFEQRIKNTFKMAITK